MIHSEQKSAIPLLAAILLLMLSGPLYRFNAIEELLSSLFQTFVILSALFAHSIKGSTRFFALPLGVVTLILQWIVFAYETEIGLLIIRDISSISFYSCILYFSIQKLFRAEKVSVDTMMQSVLIYLLIGYVFAFVHACVELLWSGSYLPLIQISQVGKLAFYQHFFFFSFVTLTTLGYGDITPVSDFARSLAILEAILGQIFLAILIPKLVSIYVQEGNKR